MINERVPSTRDITVECSLTPLPLGARMRANTAILFAWMRRSVLIRR